jgi:RNA polymerase sigma-70 factor (ECF subfamily)
VDHAGVENPRGFLITTVSRLAIDRLRQVKALREAYIGPWLPEPAMLDMRLDRAELAESVELAMLVVLETLSPLERAVFVLREAFDLPFADIAEIIGREEPAARQLAKRAREHVASRRPRFEVDRARRRQVTERFMAAASQGDLDGLTQLLAADVELVSDGGGKARSPIKVLTGADHVVRFLGAVSTPHAAELFLDSIGADRTAPIDFTVEEVNGAPAVVLWSGSPGGAGGQRRVVSVVSLVIVDGAIQTIYLIANPEKLARTGLEANANL